MQSRWSRPVRLAILASLAAGLPFAMWVVWTIVGHGPSFNDFHDFYYAAKLVAEGHSPYDKAALAALANADKQPFVVGTGYSYPLPFAIAMVPFTWLPFTSSVLTFTALSLAFYGWVVAAWIEWFHDAADFRRQALLAAGAGVYPSVFGTVMNGQANLVLLPFLAFGTLWIVDGGRPARRALGGGATGLVAVVKLIPGLFAVPLLLARRFESAIGVIGGALVALILATVVAPWAQEGSSGLMNLTESDSYFTNQSINGFVSRLVLYSERTVPLWSHGFDARVVAVLAAICFGVLTVVVLWRAMPRLSQRRGLALGLGLTLVAGLLAAPKGTYWNQVMLVVAGGLFLAVEIPDLRLAGGSGRPRLDRLDIALLALWLAGTTCQTLLWLAPPPKYVELSAIVTLATSASVYGMVALWALLARRLLTMHGEAGV